MAGKGLRKDLLTYITSKVLANSGQLNSNKQRTTKELKFGHKELHWNPAN